MPAGYDVDDDHRRTNGSLRVVLADDGVVAIKNESRWAASCVVVENADGLLMQYGGRSVPWTESWDLIVPGGIVYMERRLTDEDVQNPSFHITYNKNIFPKYSYVEPAKRM